MRTLHIGAYQNSAYLCERLLYNRKNKCITAAVCYFIFKVWEIPAKKHSRNSASGRFRSRRVFSVDSPNSASGRFGCRRVFPSTRRLGEFRFGKWSVCRENEWLKWREERRQQMKNKPTVVDSGHPKAHLHLRVWSWLSIPNHRHNQPFTCGHG